MTAEDLYSWGFDCISEFMGYSIRIFGYDFSNRDILVFSILICLLMCFLRKLSD